MTNWRLSTHYNNKNGVVVHCVECHLPPGGVEFFVAKARLGTQDLLGKIFKDSSQINWQEKSKLENANRFTFQSTCLHCHQNLFPLSLSKKGEDAHLYYNQKKEQLRCLNCHLHVGHYSKEAEAAQAFSQVVKIEQHIFTQPAQVERFENFTEFIPGSTEKFDMIAIPAGTFKMGSPNSEPYRRSDESPIRTVRVRKFWLSKTEVSWDEYEAFYRQTASRGKTVVRLVTDKRISALDAITGATPPYGSPDQGWGRGSRPVITMTHHAAVVYCQWLSQVTGKRYRLPTEAEWEYACRAGSDNAYFFAGEPKQFTRKRLWNRIFGADTTGINSYAIYAGNSRGKTQPPETIKPNPFGLVNMTGNVREFCLDWYAPDAYAGYPENDTIINPTGPSNGTEYVIRGGSYRSDAVDLRSAARAFTRTDAWLITDPQMPKSVWWYSDCTDVGFRVVCDYSENP